MLCFVPGLPHRYDHSRSTLALQIVSPHRLASCDASRARFERDPWPAGAVAPAMRCRSRPITRLRFSTALRVATADYTGLALLRRLAPSLRSSDKQVWQTALGAALPPSDIDTPGFLPPPAPPSPCLPPTFGSTAAPRIPRRRAYRPPAGPPSLLLRFALSAAVALLPPSLWPPYGRLRRRRCRLAVRRIGEVTSRCSSKT